MRGDVGAENDRHPHHCIVTVTVTEKTASAGGFLSSVMVLTLVTVVCEPCLTPVSIRSGAVYLRIEGRDEGTKRVFAKLICDSDLVPSAGRSWRRIRVVQTCIGYRCEGLLGPRSGLSRILR